MPKVGQVGCAAEITPGAKAMTAGAVAAASSPPPGYSPLQLRSAYGLDFSAITGGVGQTVAVVTAYDDPTAETDMGTYRAQYNLPPCTTANGCFKKVDATGGTSYPPQMTGWTAPTAESLDMISAICPNCHILLVEADNPAIPTTTDPDALGQAENEAVALGAKFVDNTVFTSELTYSTQEAALDSEYFDHPGVAITAPDGAGGYGPWYPAASPDLIAVGGTTLTSAPTTARGWTESAYSSTGSGCSAYEAKPSWQADTGCTDRMLNDLSADADVNDSPVAFYDGGTWITGGGNDVSAAVIAAAYALAGTPVAGSNPASYPYAHTSLINDITTGSNGTCTPAYYCTAGPGYDGPTGLGTPASAAALGPNAPSASVAGAPVIYDPATGNLELYATRNDNNLEQDAWRPTTNSWTGWVNLGGSIAGRPCAIYDPVTGNLEVYARGTGGTLEQDTWKPASGWAGWTNLGGSITGDPAAVYNPFDNAMDVFATGTGSTLEEKDFAHGSGWSAWANLGGSITGSPSANYDPGSGNLEVYATAESGGALMQDTEKPGGWAGWTNLGGVNNGVDTVYNPVRLSMEVFTAGTGATLEEKYFIHGSGWSAWQNLGGSIGGPNGVYDPDTGNLEVYARGTGGTLEQDTWKPGSGSGQWAGWLNLNGPDLAGGPVALFDPATGHLEIYAPGSDGSVHEEAWVPGSGWSAWQSLGGSIFDL